MSEEQRDTIQVPKAGPKEADLVYGKIHLAFPVLPDKLELKDMGDVVILHDDSTECVFVGESAPAVLQWLADAGYYLHSEHKVEGSPTHGGSCLIQWYRKSM